MCMKHMPFERLCQSHRCQDRRRDRDSDEHPAGIDCGEDCGELFAKEISVTLNATADWVGIRRGGAEAGAQGPVM